MGTVETAVLVDCAVDVEEFGRESAAAEVLVSWTGTIGGIVETELGCGKEDAEELGRELDDAEVLVSWARDTGTIGGTAVAELGGGKDDAEELVKVTGVVELDSSSSSLSITLASSSFS